MPEPEENATGRPSPEDYLSDFLVEQGRESDDLHTSYEFIANSLVSQLRQSAFWETFTVRLKELDEAHQIEHEFRLLAPSDYVEIAVVYKPYASLLEKTYRSNVLNNDAWPDPPAEGWITPDNWFVRVKDIVRTLVIVKYLDGAERISDLIRSVASDTDVTLEVDFEARDDGYYAVHHVVRLPLAIPASRWELETLSVPVEIQVATQLQNVIRRLTHKVYEDRRMRAPSSDKKWQWDWTSDEFVPNYLGHILHYLEGMIMDVRHKQETRVN